MPRIELRRYLVQRVPIVASLLLLAALVHIVVRPAAELSDRVREESGELGWRARAAEFIARVHGMWVTPDVVHFLPLDQRPAWYEGFHYVPVVFTAVPERPPIQVPLESQRPDLFYVELAVSPDGVPVDSRRFTNVTHTPLVEEAIAARAGTTVVLSSRVSGRIETLHLVDFSGDRTEPVVPEGTAGWVGALMIRLDNLQNTGRWDGADRRSFMVSVPADRVESEVDGDVLEVALHHEGAEIGRARLGLASGVLLAGAELLEARDRPQRVTETPSTWTARLVRNLRWVGAERMAVVEQVSSGLWDGMKGLFTGEPPTPPFETAVSGPEPVFVTRGEAASDEEWPPPDIEPMPGFEEPMAGEGRWALAAPEWVRQLPNAPPAFLQTVVRTDPEHPGDRVLMMAMDLRQLEIGYQQGTVHPESSTGRRGTGEVSREGDTLLRLVAAWNGGVETALGASGSVVDRVVFLAPRPHQATLAWTDDSDAMFLGVWGQSSAIPEHVVTLRQSLPPLVALGEGDPTRQWEQLTWLRWGRRTTRSGLCFRGQHTLKFFWSARADGRSLARAMNMAGCEAGMHLDVSPDDTGWEFYRVDDLEVGRWQSAPGTGEMRLRRGSYLEASPRDFFYALLRPTFDQRLPPVEGRSWNAQSLPPAGGFLPAVARARADAGEVRLVALDVGRFRATLAFGTAEPAVVGPAEPPEPLHPVGVVTFDATRANATRGLVVDGRIYGLRAGHGVWLELDDGRTQVVAEPDADSPTRLELMAPESLVGFGGVCAAAGSLDDGRALVLGWGPLDNLDRRLSEIGIHVWGILGCGRHLARIESLAEDSEGWEAVDLLRGDTRRLTELQGARSRLLFEPLPPEPRIQRLRLDDQGRILGTGGDATSTNSR